MDDLANDNGTEGRNNDNENTCGNTQRKSYVYGMAAILTSIAWNAFGFGWSGIPSLGFVTADDAEQLATAKMERAAIPLAAQLCAITFNTQDPTTVAAKREKL